MPVNRVKITVKSVLIPVISIVFFILASLVIYQELKSFNYHEIIGYIYRTSFLKFLLAAVFTALSYLCLMAIEALLFVYARQPLPFRQTALASFVSTSISHNLGYAIFSAGTLRYRFYSNWNVSVATISTVIGAHAAFFWLGFLLLSGGIFLSAPIPLPVSLHLPIHSLFPLGIVFFIIILAFLVLSILGVRIHVRQFTIQLPRINFTIALMILSALDWFFSGLALYVVLPAGVPYSLGKCLGIYMLAQIIGTGSQVPGGMGVFESVFLSLMALGTLSPALAGALILFRIVYYIIPLIVSTLLLVWQSVRSGGQQILRFSQAIGNWFSSLLPILSSIIILIGGAILLISGSTPAVSSRLAWINHFFPLPVIEISHFLASLVGTILIFLALGLKRRLNMAFRLTIVMLLLGIIFSLIKGVDYEEALFLSIMLLLLAPTQRHFYRQASLFSQPLDWSWVISVIFVFICSIWLIFFTAKHLEYSHRLWWQVELAADIPRSMRALTGGIILLLILSFRRLLRPAFREASPVLASEKETQLAPIIAQAPETYANLAYLGDKKFLFSDSGQTFIMYGVKGRSWIAMGDPIGDPGEKIDLIWKFYELCDQRNAWPVFYEVSFKYLPVYIDLGLVLFKLGEEGRVDLDEFSLQGIHSKWMRKAINRTEKEGYVFSIILPENLPARLVELKAVSDDWLKTKKAREKGFSLGFFSEEYLKRYPVAVVEKEGQITAFANIWLGPAGSELSIDLMRFSAQAPERAIDFLFINLMLWGKEKQYHWFNLGMAPFSGFVNHAISRFWNRVGAFIFRQGEFLYNFRGLRQYKEKFNPQWEPHYLASPNTLALPFILANVTSLVSKGLKGAFRR